MLFGEYQIMKLFFVLHSLISSFVLDPYILFRFLYRGQGYERFLT
jgi:hypothetical protein